MKVRLRTKGYIDLSSGRVDITDPGYNRDVPNRIECTKIRSMIKELQEANQRDDEILSEKKQVDANAEVWRYLMSTDENLFFIKAHYIDYFVLKESIGYIYDVLEYSEDNVAPGTQYKHYAFPQRYAAMMKAHREMSLAGYDVYRFGGWELLVNETKPESVIIEHVKSFFDGLFNKYFKIT